MVILDNIGQWVSQLSWIHDASWKCQVLGDKISGWNLMMLWGTLKNFGMSSINNVFLLLLYYIKFFLTSLYSG